MKADRINRDLHRDIIDSSRNKRHEACLQCELLLLIHHAAQIAFVKITSKMISLAT